MKRCPVCQKTFDDSLRFCQIDGTPLVEETQSQPADPFKTMVGGAPIKDDDADLLQLPEDSDSTKTLISSGNPGKESTGFDQIKEDIKKDVSPSSSFGDSAPKSGSNPFSGESANQSPFNNPASSPFDSPPGYQPPFKESDSTFGAPQTPFNQSPFDRNQDSFGQPMQQSAWTPPPAPEASWQNQNIGANTPFQPPPAIQGQNQTLPIISLVCGVLGFVTMCCYGGIPFGLAALIIGFLGMQNVNKDLMNYSGKGLAIGGMVLGGIAFVLNVLFLILGIAFSSFGNLNR